MYLERCFPSSFRQIILLRYNKFNIINLVEPYSHNFTDCHVFPFYYLSLQLLHQRWSRLLSPHPTKNKKKRKEKEKKDLKKKEEEKCWLNCLIIISIFSSYHIIILNISLIKADRCFFWGSINYKNYRKWRIERPRLIKRQVRISAQFFGKYFL